MTPHRFRIASVAILIGALLAAHAAYAVNGQGQPTTVLSDPRPNVVSTYTFASFMLTGQDYVTEYELTFPAGFDITDASPVEPAGTIVAKDVATGRLHVRLSTPWTRPDRLGSFTVAGVRNAPSAGTYPMENLRLLVGAQNKPNDPLVWQNDLVLAPIDLIGSHLYVSISAHAVEFVLSPTEPAAPQSVSVTIDSSHPYTITREVTGDAEMIGLAVDGGASGAKEAGAGTFQDTYSASVPWTTAGDNTYLATVTYTVVQ